VAAIIRFAEGGTFANIFLYASLVAAGTGTGILVHKSLRRAKERRSEAAAATKSPFRAPTTLTTSPLQGSGSARAPAETADEGVAQAGRATLG
jgi:hypothetical protein